MKKIFIQIILALNISITYSQDLITTKSGEDIPAKILEVGTSEIKYKKFNHEDGPTYSILKSATLMIRYQDGSKDIFQENPEDNNTQSSKSDENLLFKGQEDANKFYIGYRGAVGGTVATSLLASPLIGLIPAIACSVTPPQEQTLNYPNPDLYKNTDYRMGYTQQAKKIKNQRIWRSWTICLGVNLIAYSIITSIY